MIIRLSGAMVLMLTFMVACGGASNPIQPNRQTCSDSVTIIVPSSQTVRYMLATHGEASIASVAYTRRDGVLITVQNPMLSFGATSDSTWEDDEFFDGPFTAMLVTKGSIVVSHGTWTDAFFFANGEGQTGFCD